ncbi:MAG: histidine--tRNA ligase [Vicinamibacterales bacterium]
MLAGDVRTPPHVELMSTIQPPRGMRDFLPEDVRRRTFVINAIKRVYERYGFEPLETPAVENIDTLLGKYGEEGNKLIFKILKRGEHESTGVADLALRYDLTVPLARVVAQYQGQLPRFFKRYQIQPVWRADRPARGRFREFYQCDVDALGSRSMVVEAELCAAACEALNGLGFTDFRIRLNHRRLLAALLEQTGVAIPSHGDALVAIDKLDKIGRDGVLAELTGRGIAPDAGERLLQLFAATDADPLAALERLEAAVGSHQAGLDGLAELREIVRLAARTPAAGRIAIDVSLARGLSYYTGAIMEIAVPDLAGSLGGGGRYDNLVGMFLGKDVPACGFSLGLERILVVMTERGMFPAGLATAPADVLVTIWNSAASDEALALAHELRTAGLRVEVFPEADKLGKQFRYAATRAIRFVTIVGDDEQASGQVAIKDLPAATQTVVARAEAGSWLRQRVGAHAEQVAPQQQN